uniref:Uncharacterized protein LOC100181173 n=1 Tax=Phallusia mammillata TaxID=59560 RepID=A0A6F9DHL5_9ASCI|nr:uncharacterized protein LOC100181173 [Phallusia mammillata]
MTDSTDKLLDEIDAKLKQLPTGSGRLTVDRKNTPTSSCVDFTLKAENAHRMFYSKEPIASTQAPPYENPQSHKTYDEDINKLRKMLQQQSYETVPEENVLQEETFPRMDSEEPSDSFTTFMSTSASTSFPENIKEQNAYCNSCNCSEEIDRLIKERNELRARIHRGEASRTSIEERQELERALHSAKSEIFRERKRSRQIIEDLEEKLEEAQHLYETSISDKDGLSESVLEKLSMKDKLVESLQDQVISLNKKNDDQRITKEKELNNQTNKIDKLTQELDSSRNKLQEQQLGYEELKQSILKTGKAKCERMLDESKERERKATKKCMLAINELETENKKLIAIIEDLSKKQETLSKELEEKNHIINEDLKKREQGLNEKANHLEEKNECLRQEISKLFTQNSQFEIEMIKREKQQKQEFVEKEQEQKNEIKDLHGKIEHLQLEVADALLKTKNGRVEAEHRERLLISNVNDQCQKLLCLYKSMKSHDCQSGIYDEIEQSTTKEALARLHELVQLVCRTVNELLCEVARLKRNGRKKNSYYTASTEELSMLKGCLEEKDQEIQNLKLNMNHWKDLTAQRLTTKFQEELQLQMERKINKIQQNPQVSLQAHSATSANDSSTVKLLCHLQSRVKQLRSENDFLKSSSTIRGINDGDL